MRKLAPIHPGEILREEFLIPYGLTANGLALSLSVPATRISEITNERRSITADTAMRLARFFKMTPEFWMNLQRDFDLAMIEDQSGKEIRKAVRPCKSIATLGT